MTENAFPGGLFLVGLAVPKGAFGWKRERMLHEQRERKRARWAWRGRERVKKSRKEEEDAQNSPSLHDLVIRINSRRVFST